MEPSSTRADAISRLNQDRQPAGGPIPAGHRLIVVGASADGVEPLVALARGLPADFPATVGVVLHTPPYGRSLLPDILSRAGLLRASHARHGEPIRPGRILIAPPDHHLVVQRGFVEVVRGPRENRSRPSVDVLFRSAALAYGPRVVGVILSGVLDDGASGLRIIKTRGGVAIVQEPVDAVFDGMPRSALQAVKADFVLPAAEITSLLVELSRETAHGSEALPATNQPVEELALTDVNLELMKEATHPGEPSTFACPDCHGVLWELRENDLVHYRCRVGHAFGAETLLTAQTEGVEDALWMALRTLEERADLLRRLHERAMALGHTGVAGRYDEQIEETHDRSARIRRLLLSNGRAVDGVAGVPTAAAEAGL